jgi:hypothetical protein
MTHGRQKSSRRRAIFLKTRYGGRRFAKSCGSNEGSNAFFTDKKALQVACCHDVPAFLSPDVSIDSQAGGFLDTGLATLFTGFPGIRRGRDLVT